MVLAEILPPPQRRNSFSGSDKSPTQNKSYWWSFTSKLLRSDSVSNSNQHIATQKLRESKYFREDEERLFCAVIETGFIVEMKIETTTHDHQNTETKSHQQQHYFGIVSVESKKREKGTSAKNIYVYTVTKLNCDENLKVVKLNVVELWKEGYKIRINNMNDRSKKINSEKQIKNQITFAIKHRKNFHNSLHFADSMRYGETIEEKKKIVSESVKWSTVGINASLRMYNQRERASSFSK